MTSLAQQLQRLALPQSAPGPAGRREAASLLFEPRDAAAMDRSSFFALGCTGLEELLGIEPAFREFQDSLFSGAAEALERSVQPRELNARLDAGIRLFLARLCPYFLLRPAHKCVEWLVHRFHVHRYNADSLLACALPYHHTHLFTRVLQLLPLRDPSNRWSWMSGLQKVGVSLSRGALVSRCSSDLGFMEFICTLVTTAVQAYSGHGGQSQLRVVFSFYASTVVSALEADRLTEGVVSTLLPYVQQGLKAPLADYKAASYMIVCQLAVRAGLEDGLVDALAVHVGRSLQQEPVLSREGVACLIVLLQNQKEGAVGDRAFGRLLSVPSLASSIQALSASHDVAPLLRYLLPRLVGGVVSCRSGEGVSPAGRPGPSGGTGPLALLTSILQDVPLTGQLDQTVARLLLEAYLSQTRLPPEDGSALDQRLLPLVRLLESRYCGALDGVLAGHVIDVSDEEQKRLFHRFLSLTVSSGKFQMLGESDASLLLSLTHPRAWVRASALQHLRSLLTCSQPHSLDDAFLRDAVSQRLKDDAPQVVAACLQVLEVLLGVVDPEDTVSSLLTLLQRAEPSGAEPSGAEPSGAQSWLAVQMEAVRLLSDPRLGNGDAHLERRIGWRLLPLLVVSSPLAPLARSVARSPAVSRHPLTSGWASELDELMGRSSEPDFLGVANQRLVSTLTRNLTSMEPLPQRDALEQLALAVECLPGSGSRSRTSFLVLTRTLLLVLGRLGDTQHLLTAQRAYLLLEPALLRVVSEDHAPDAAGHRTVPASFSDALTLYLSRCEAGSSDLAFGSALLVLLRDFITALRCDHASFKGAVWWDPDRLDTTTCCYLSLTCRLFGVLVSGAGGGGAASAGFRDLMKLLIQVHLPEPLTLFRFLCVLWGHTSNHGDQLDVRGGAVLQTQALYVGGALLSVQSEATLQTLAAANYPVFLSLLCCLSSPVGGVRGAALGCLQSLSAASSSPFQPITEQLLRSREELLADPSYLSQVVGVVHGDASRRRAVQQLLQGAGSTSCPSSIAAVLLQALTRVTGQDVLSALLPLLTRLLEQSGPDTPPLLPADARLLQLVLTKYDEASAPLLGRDPRSLDLLVRALNTPTGPHGHTPSCQLAALERITRGFFSALGEGPQQRLLGVLFDLLLDCRSPQVSGAVSSVFKEIAVDAQLVANELAPLQKVGAGSTVQQSRRSRTAPRGPDGVDGGPQGGPQVGVSWQRVTLILELLQHKKKLRRSHLLVPALFSLLARSLEAGRHDDVNMEYTKQLLLGGLLHVCYKLGAEGGPTAVGVLQEDVFSVELVVQVVRSSCVPQTHHQALLLLGAAAAIFPEKVLHNIMPIFTFMGGSVLRLDDAYSFRVIHRTVQTVVPALIQAQRHSAQLRPVGVRILHVFADALPHVPAHRRLPILTQLLTTLGPAHFLWVLMLLLFKLHATRGAGAATGKDVDGGVDFWISVCCQFGVSDQVSALISILHFLLRLPDDKDDEAEIPEAQKKDEEAELIFSVDAHSSKELRHFKFLSVSFMAQLLGSTHFIAKVADADDVIDESLQQLLQRLLEAGLRYTLSVARGAEQNADRPGGRYWRGLIGRAYDALDKLNALLPPDSFLAVVRGLLGNELPAVRRRGLELLNSRLQRGTAWDEGQVAALLQLTAHLQRIVSKSGAQEAEPAITRQTALYSLKLICRRVGATHQEALLPVLQQVVQIVTATQEDRNVVGGALLCIAEVVGTLRALAIPQLPRLMPAVLRALADRKQPPPNDVHLLSAVAALQRVADTLPNFISPYLQDATLQVCRLTQLVEPAPSSSVGVQLAARLAAVRSTLASRVPPRVLLPAVSSCYRHLVAQQQGQLGALMSLLEEHIGHMGGEQLGVHQSELTSFFLVALDFRAEHCQGDLETAAATEGRVIDCLVAMVMKLSEVTFRPLFFKLLDWSQSGGGERQLTFYHLTDSIAGRLKGLFVLFAGNLVKPMADLLRRSSGGGKDENDLLFSGPPDLKVSLLLRFLLDCLQKIFLYDTQRFLSPKRADALMGPLVQQLENLRGGEQEYQQRVTQYLLPCLGQFAVALADDAQWRALNTQVLLRTRHTHPKVRLSSLLVLMELVSRLKENYVVLLPETLPFLSELMEDECEEVEHQVHQVIQEMEKILGEPLQSYF
ncbi:HEAT repeat-containing protein 1 isoform X2 [Antennarius striatus]|uniref:HEAT repeat-containing protein 1 isoform X2 n=1 Tax=Antennarius striatus TaxID=241820 RepID=UPI0035B35677